jgi:hypothetical protein
MAKKSPETQELQVIGKLKPRSGHEINSSVLGVGFETLDRELFNPAKCYEPLGKLGIKWARCQTGWNRCEKVKGQYDFSWLDEVVDNLLIVGIQPWFNVGYGNKLYTPGAENNSAVGWIPTNSEEAMKGWENFVKALAVHFKGRVRYYELWNEPNVTPFWRPVKPSPEAYVEFIRRTEGALHQEFPDAVVIGGGFGGFPTGFLARSLEIGLVQYIDKLSFHPYTLIPEWYPNGNEYIDEVSDWRKLIAKYNPEMNLWQGECGCPSTNYSVGALKKYDWNESRQARWLLRRLINDLGLGLEMISWYHTCDQAGYGKAVYAPSEKVNAYFGLLRLDDYSPKPSYYAFQNMCALFDSQTQVSDFGEMMISFAEDVDTSALKHATFIRDGFFVCAYWLAVNVTEDRESQSFDIRVNLNSNSLLKKPVLIDPMNGQVMKLDGTLKKMNWYFPGVPLKDYPMIITDERVIEIVDS